MSPMRTAVLVVTLMINVAHAEESLGRLFLTPEQRHELDVLRDPDAPHPATGPASPDADRTVLLNGVVRRSRGPDVVWVNGARVTDTRTSAAPGQPLRVRRGPDTRNRVTLEDGEGTVARLKPGQLWDPATGRVADCYGCTAPHKTTDLASPPERPAGLPAATPPETPAAPGTVPPAPATPTTQP